MPVAEAFLQSLQESQITGERYSVDPEVITKERFPDWVEVVSSDHIGVTINVKDMRYPISGAQAQRFVHRLLEKKKFIHFIKYPSYKPVELL